jgi:hypothetical protein
MPQTALMRQLPRLTRLGVLDGDTRRAVVAQPAGPSKPARRTATRATRTGSPLGTARSATGLSGSCAPRIPKRWSYTALASAVGCSPELIAAILKGRARTW